MKRILLLASICSVFLVFEAAMAAQEWDWSYSGDTGPENWAGLTPRFSACSGRNQSPIDLTDFIEANLQPIKISYQSRGHEILNNGHTVQVNYIAGSTVSIDGNEYELKQFHFHAPSENRVNGQSFAMEAHYVHQDPDGNFAVIALLFEQGAENEALSAIWEQMPSHKGKKKSLASPFDAARLLPEKLDYYLFNGSLTTPPCTEGVRWLVMKEPVKVSKEQVNAFTRTMHHPNNRPVQPVNARPVLK